MINSTSSTTRTTIPEVDILGDLNIEENPAQQRHMAGSITAKSTRAIPHSLKIRRKKAIYP